MANTETVKLRRLFGAQVRRYRKDRGWTQSDLASKTDLSLDMVGRIERGQASPSLDTVAKLSHRLDVSAAALFGGQTAKVRGERSKIIETILSSLGRLDGQELERVQRVIIAATKG